MTEAPDYTAEIIEIKHLTEDVIELHLGFLSGQQLSYVSGQFMEFLIQDQGREYSIANPMSSGNDVIRFCIKRYPGGLTDKWLSEAEQGQKIFLRGPYGNFYPQPEDNNRNWLCIATGVGIAPFCGIIPAALQSGYFNQIKLLFGVHAVTDLFYQDKFESLAAEYSNFQFIPMLSQPSPNWVGQTGRITDYIANNHEVFKDWLSFVCGSLVAVQDGRKALLVAGFPARDIRTESFS